MLLQNEYRPKMIWRKLILHGKEHLESLALNIHLSLSPFTNGERKDQVQTTKMLSVNLSPTRPVNINHKPTTHPPFSSVYRLLTYLVHHFLLPAFLFCMSLFFLFLFVSRLAVNLLFLLSSVFFFFVSLFFLLFMIQLLLFLLLLLFTPFRY